MAFASFDIFILPMRKSEYVRVFYDKTVAKRGAIMDQSNLLNPNLVLFPFTSKSFAVIRIFLSCVLGNAKEFMYFSKTQFIPYDRVQSSGNERSQT